MAGFVKLSVKELVVVAQVLLSGEWNVWIRVHPFFMIGDVVSPVPISPRPARTSRADAVGIRPLPSRSEDEANRSKRLFQDSGTTKVD